MTYNKSKNKHTLDSKYNDYAGRYKGRLLSPRMWAICNKRENYVLVSNENFLKQFCQLDTMIHDKQFLHYIKDLVQSDAMGSGKDTNQLLKEIWLKVRSITLNDNFFRTRKINKENFSTASGNFLTHWENELIQGFVSDYREFNQYLEDENYTESRYYDALAFDELEYQEYLDEVESFYAEIDTSDEDELPF
jgi:hypothetical protein